MKNYRPAVMLFGVALILGLCSSCARENQKKEAEEQAERANHRAADKAAIRALDADWVKAVAAKDANRTASFYAEEGTLLAPGAPAAIGPDAIVKTWAGLMATPGFALAFAPAKIEVSKAGDLAYELGEYELTTSNKKGKPETVKAKYVVVWGKQAGGSWKALVDAPTTAQ